MAKNMISNFGAGMTQEQLGFMWDRMKTSSNDSNFHIIEVITNGEKNVIDLQAGLSATPCNKEVSCSSSKPQLAIAD